MEIYLVGGAVRDELLGRSTKERDWVVVGATPEMMLAKGYRKVGKDFPVFLHPMTGEEYALARTERKSGKGYYGFDCYAAPDVTLEEDLKRRDLTINAIAKKEDGTIIDPFGGVRDLQDKKLRHVSNAFVEDPLRVLRIARFAARFAELGFCIVEDTYQLLRVMIRQNELDYLAPERVWQELNRALSESMPQVFFQVLRRCGALQVLFKEIDQLYGVPATPKWHPEIDTGIHIEEALFRAVSLTSDVSIRFAVLMHDLGKGVTPIPEWPSHHDHDKRGVALVQYFCNRYPVPNDYRDLALLVTEYHLLIPRIMELKSSTILKILERLDVYRKPKRLEQILLATWADQGGRLDAKLCPFPEFFMWQDCYMQTTKVDSKVLMKQGYEGAKLGEQIRLEKLNIIKAFKKQLPSRLTEYEEKAKLYSS